MPKNPIEIEKKIDLNLKFFHEILISCTNVIFITAENLIDFE